MLHVLDIRPVEIAFCKTQTVDRIEKIGLANPIVAAYTYNPLRKGKRGVVVVFELKSRYRMQRENGRLLLLRMNLQDNN